MPLHDLAASIRAARGDLSFRAFARILECSASYLKEIESGKATPTPRFLERLRACDALKTLPMAGPQRPTRKRKTRKPSLPPIATRLRSVFRVPRPNRPVQPLAQAFALARYTSRGRELVQELQAQRRPGAFLHAAKWQAQFLNGPEQRLLLSLLTPEASLHEVHPRVLGIPLPVVEPPGHLWLAAATPCEAALLVTFAQLAVEVRPGWTRRMDFFMGLSDHGLVNVEVDGPIHTGRQAQDRVRAEQISLPTLRVPADHVDSPDFLKWLLQQLRDTLRSKSS